MTSTEQAPALVVDRLTIAARFGSVTTDAVSDLSFSVGRGERIGIVGESGSGKSLTMRAILGLLPSGTRLRAGSVQYLGRTLTAQQEIQRICSVVFQEALSALNPTRRVGDVIADGAESARGLGRRDAVARAIELMRDVGIADPELRHRMYSHELSGGLRQRVMIAAALSTDPDILICDEPTTALDVTIQKQIVDLLLRLTTQRQMTLVFVSHDLGLVDVLCDRLLVMYAGRLVESGRTADVLGDPRHPYTKALVEATLPVTHRVSFRPAPSADERALWAAAPAEVHA